MSTDTAGRNYILIRPEVVGIWRNIPETIRYRSLVPFFARRALERLYARTYLGIAWFFIRPGFPLLVLTISFGFVLGIETANVPYYIFLVLGVTAWTAFSRTAMYTTRSLEINRKYLRTGAFPWLIVPIGQLAPSIWTVLVHLIFAALGFAVYAVIDQNYFVLSWRLPLGLLCMLLACTMGFGLGIILSIPGALYRDIRFTLRMTMGFGMFLTPVAYPISLVPEEYRWVMALNPLTGVVETFRWSILGTDGIGFGWFMYSVFMAGLILLTGLWFFHRFEYIVRERL